MQLTRRSLLAGAAALAGVAALGGCSARNETPAAEKSTSGTTTETQKPPADAPATKGGTQSKVLVAYFSRADENYAGGGKEWLEVGHTKVMAGYIADALGADTYEIVPTSAYPTGYDECCDVAKQEQQADTRPTIANPLPDVSAYDTVFIGCPIWWGEEPMILRTFTSGVDLSGKTVVPFTTHGGSGLGNVPSNLREQIPGAKFLDGHAVSGVAVDGARDEVTTWVKGLGIA